MTTLNMRAARCVMNAQGGEGEIDIYGTIGKDWFGDGIDPLEFKQELDALDVSLLKVRIHSYGGFVDEGQAIISALRRHKAEKHVFVDGMAASMASVILQVGDKRYCASNGAVFIHDPVGLCWGSLSEMERYATEMKQIKEQILDIYEERSNLSRDEISELMEKETRMTAQEALDWGFIDEIGDEVSADPQNHASNFDNMFKIAASKDHLKMAPHLALQTTSGKPEPKKEKGPMDPKASKSGDQPETENATENALSPEQIQAAERKRITDIQEMSQKGVEDLVTQFVADGTSAGDAALAINKKLRENAVNSNQLDTKRTQSNAIVTDDGSDEDNGAVADDDFDTQWEKNVDNCKDTFLSKDAYVAYKQHNAAGLVKVQGENKQAA